MEQTTQMAMELENMINRGEIEEDVTGEITLLVQDLRKGVRSLDEVYRASASHKILEIIDTVNERIKR